MGSHEDEQLYIADIMERYGTQMLRMAMLYLKDRALAEDAVQESFIKIYRSRASYDDSYPEKTWIMSILVNTCKDMLRSSWFRRISLSAAIPEPVSASSDDEDPSDGRVIQQIEKLPLKYKDVILLYYYQEMTVAEIAQILGQTENCIRVRLNRARNLLKTRLKGWWNPDEEPVTDKHQSSLSEL